MLRRKDTYHFYYHYWRITPIHWLLTVSYTHLQLNTEEEYISYWKDRESDHKNEESLLSHLLFQHGYQVRRRGDVLVNPLLQIQIESISHHWMIHRWKEKQVWEYRWLEIESNENLSSPINNMNISHNSIESFIR